MKTISKLSLGVLMGAAALSAMAVPARRDVHTVTQPDGTTVQYRLVGDESRHYMVTLDGKILTTEADGTIAYARVQPNGMLQSTGVALSATKAAPAAAMSLREAEAIPMPANSPRRVHGQGLGRTGTNFPALGEPNVLTILVEYQDVKFNLDDPAEYFTNMVNQEGFSEYGGTGSVKDYFVDNSNGQFVPHFDMLGPVTLPEKRSYYGGNNWYNNDEAPEDMVIHAINILDPDVDFSIYDNDGDGVVDNVYLIYAGAGEASGGPAASVWPHSWELSAAGKNLTVDGVVINHYGCSNEWFQNRPDGIGTFVHEFSHVMGLPDLYHTSDSWADYTPSSWSVLDYGPYNNDGCTPPAYSMYERNAMGWAVPTLLEGDMNGTLEHVLTSNAGYVIPTAKDNEFFLLENRQQEGWDKYLPGHGMLVWHIDYNEAIFNSNTVNNNSAHQYVEIIEAGGRTGGAYTQDYAFPGPLGITSLTSKTTVKLKDWNGNVLTDYDITEITEDDGVITFILNDGGNAIAVPTPKPAAEIEQGPDYFIAAWEPVEGAVDYQVSAYIAGAGESSVITNDMGSATKATMPEGWESSTTDSYTSSGNFGEAKPSLKLAASNAYVQSPVGEGDVVAISYWRKGQNTKNGSVIGIYGLIDGNWKLIDEDAPESGDADTYVVAEDKIPTGVKAVKLEYTKVLGNVAIDDIKIEFGAGDALIPGYENRSTEGATTLKVSPVNKGDKCRFRVRAVREDGKTTRYSSYVDLTMGETSIEGVENDSNAPVEYFDMLGRRVANPAPGSILIRRQGSKVAKTVIR